MHGGRREGAGRPKGARNKRTVAVEQAMQTVAAKLKDAVPDAFDGDGVAFMQSVYCDPFFPVELRLDAAKSAARFERPALAATLTRDVTPEVPAVHKLALDYSLLTAEELVELRRLIIKATPKDEPPTFEGEVEEEDGE